MAICGVYIAASGYEYHGPKGRLGFAPRLSPENFRAAFTAAKGWGTYSQEIKDTHLHAAIKLHWENLKLSTLTLPMPSGVKAQGAVVTVNGAKTASLFKQANDAVTVDFSGGLILTAKDQLEVNLS